MANISSAEGTFKFEPEFVAHHKKVIQNWIDRHSQSYYGFALDDNKLDEDGSIRFYANGRWAYCWTLQQEGIGWVAKDEATLSPDDLAENKAVKALGRALAKEKSVVTVEYTDYEPGCAVLYKATTELCYTSETEFKAVEISEEEPEYNLRNITNEGLESVAYDFNCEEDKNSFLTEIKSNYADNLKATDRDPGKLCSTIIENALASEYRNGIILEWEAEDFERLLDIADVAA